MKIHPYPPPADLSRYQPKVNNPETYYGLPGEITFCKSCVISNQRPNSTVEFKHTAASKKIGRAHV